MVVRVLTIDQVRVPDRLAESYRAWSWTLADQQMPDVAIFRLERGGQSPLYARLARSGQFAFAHAEAERMRWAHQFLPVPRVTDAGTDGEVAWLVSEAPPGIVATDPTLQHDPAVVAKLFALGLRRFHDLAPVEACPFDFRLAIALEFVRERVEAGLVEVERDVGAHDFTSASAALEELERLTPGSEEVVVCHGDYCLENVLVDDGLVSGYRGLGSLGLADRWRDVAVGVGSVTSNLGPGFEDVFYDAYGIAPDDGRMAFYRLLHDLS